MANFAHGDFFPKNPQKYVGTGKIEYRSSWELSCMHIWDQHPNVVHWSSEPFKIPYQDPFTGKKRHYIPDFLVVYIDKNGIKHGEMIEVKPIRQTMLESAKSKNDKYAIAINTAKWKSAVAWCDANGLVFRVLTESQIYQNTSKR
jgi:hypothetical protein